LEIGENGCGVSVVGCFLLEIHVLLLKFLQLLELVLDLLLFLGSISSFLLHFRLGSSPLLANTEHPKDKDG